MLASMRLKFKIRPLVDEMLDQIPEEIWASSTTTFLDPAMGGGQFIIPIIERLRKHGHSEENIKGRVYGYESNILFVQYVSTKYKIANKRKISATLEFGGLKELKELEMKFDVILMNPPFNLPYEEPRTLQRYELGRGRPQQGSDYLMLERALRLLKPGSGRLLIVLPHAIASGSAVEDIRSFVEEKANVHGCISLPVGTFKPFGDSNARTCILYLRRGTPGKRRFLAQAEAVGYDITTKQYRELDDNDLPDIALAYHEKRSAL